MDMPLQGGDIRTREAAATPLGSESIALVTEGLDILTAGTPDSDIPAYRPADARNARLADAVVDALHGLPKLTALELTFFSTEVVALVQSRLSGVQVRLELARTWFWPESNNCWDEAGERLAGFLF